MHLPGRSSVRSRCSFGSRRFLALGSRPTELLPGEEQEENPKETTSAICNPDWYCCGDRTPYFAGLQQRDRPDRSSATAGAARDADPTNELGAARMGAVALVESGKDPCLRGRVSAEEEQDHSDEGDCVVQHEASARGTHCEGCNQQHAARR